jgi:hypothetical protein
MSEVEEGQKIFREMAAKDVVTATEKMVAEGTAMWVADPQVVGVIGLVYTGTNKALVVVYIKSKDFECDDEVLSSKF